MPSQPMTQILLDRIATLVTRADRPEILSGASVLVRDGVIVDVGPAAELRRAIDPATTDIVDCSDRLVMPGLVNAHNHTPWSVINLAYSAAAALGEQREGDFDSLEKIEEHVLAPMAWFDYENTFDLALCGMLDQIRYGTTTTADANNRPDAMVRAAIASGIRYVLQPQMLTSIDIEGIDEDGYLEQAERCIRDYHIGGSDRVTVAVHPSLPWNCTRSLLERSVDLAERYNVQIATHLYEVAAEKERANAVFADIGGAMGYLRAVGLLGPRTVFFHGIELDAGEVDQLAAAGCAVVHNPELNGELFARVADVRMWLERGLTVGLGTDYGQFDMFTAVKLASLLPRMVLGGPEIDPWTLLEIATLGGARVMRLDNKVGTIEVGKRADLIAIDLARASGLIPFSDDPLWLAYLLTRQATRIEVSESMVDGVFLRRDGAFTTLDERDIVGRARERSRHFIADYRRMLASGKPWHRKVHRQYELWN